MKVIKPYDYSYEGPDGLARTHCYGTNETWVRLDPGEYVCRDVECPKCRGDAMEWWEPFGPNTKAVWWKCSHCNGTGKVPGRVKAE